MSKRNGRGASILTPEDLTEFRLRRNTLDHARNQFLMVEESYNRWSKNIGLRYKLKGKFTVDSATGVLKAVAG